MKIFNPFEKPFSDVKETDLTKLNNVSEGWNVEYKKEKQNGKSIAKSVSSFANSHGGLYFVGIESNNNLPVNFDGVKDSPDIVRDSVRGNVQPFPYFKTHIISLKNGNHILMVVIPEGRNPPYIHSSGKIYRRQEAASDPLAEKNRYAIDQLYEKAKEYQEKIEEFRQNEFTFCDAEDFPYLEIYVNTRPFNSYVIEDIYITEKLEKLFKKFKEDWSIKEKIGEQEPIISGSIPFDVFNTYSSSFVGRALLGKNISFNGLTFEFDCYCNCKFFYPIPVKTEELTPRFTKILEKYTEVEYIRVLDITSIFTLVTGLLSKYFEVLQDKGYKDEIEIKIGLTNIHRTTLYINNEKFFDYIEKYGLPVCMKDQQYFPPKAIRKKIDRMIHHPISETGIIFSFISNALGVPSDVAVPAVYENLTKQDTNLKE